MTQHRRARVAGARIRTAIVAALTGAAALRISRATAQVMREAIDRIAATGRDAAALRLLLARLVADNPASSTRRRAL